MEVTGRTGDGGIDGKGIIKLQSVLSYHVVFQCKRYKESVGSGAIRDFHGAMMGRADKGLFITTGTFTRDAIKEATRDGASTIDLIDGEELVDMLKQLRLGVVYWTRTLCFRADGLPTFLEEFSPETDKIPGITRRLGDEPEDSAPGEVLASFAPRIGRPHEQDYQPIGGIFERQDAHAQGYDRVGTPDGG